MLNPLCWSGEIRDWVKPTPATTAAAKSQSALPPDAWRGVSQATGIEAAIDKATGTKAVPGNTVDLLIEGQYMESLWPTLKAAKDSILISSLKIDDGPYGKQTAEILAEKAKAGVQVRVLLDTFNSRGGTGKDSIDLMRKAGVTVHMLDKTIGRTVMEIQHRKLTIVDGHTAYVGGQNLDWAGHNAHDATLKVRGPVVANLHQLSVDLWRQVGAPALPDPPTPHPAPVGNTVLRPLVTDPCDRSFKDALFAAIDAAKHHIYLDQVFFSDNDVISRLGKAVQRGVAVELVIPRKSYSKEINAVNRLDLPKLVKMGIHVRLNPAETHMKAVTVDGTWGVLGSTNLDDRALNDNYELSLAISNPETVKELDRRILLPTILSSPLAKPDSLAVPKQPWHAALKDRVLSWGRRFL